MKKILLFPVLLLIIAGAYLGIQSLQKTKPIDPSYAPGYISGKTMVTSTPSRTESIEDSPTPLNKDDQTDSTFNEIKQLLPKASWEAEKTDTENIAGKTYKGTSISGTYQSNTITLSDFREKNKLTDDGWSVDENLMASGTNGNAWGYTIDREGGKELLYISYTNVSFTPLPGETKCPCTLEVKVFHTDQFSE